MEARECQNMPRGSWRQWKEKSPSSATFFFLPHCLQLLSCETNRLSETGAFVPAAAVAAQVANLYETFFRRRDQG